MSHRKPRKLSLVKFDFDNLSPTFHTAYPFKRGGTYVFIGEIPNMLGHCVVADHKTGKIYSGYHTENFIELSEEEV
jgi:hypothetical protein